jgi:predicted nucleic acid-binding protein
MITPKQMINYKIPRSTQGILDNKEMVMGKLIQNGVPDELINTIAQALDTDSEDIANIAPLIVAQFPNIFEKSKYQVFDGVIASTERAKAADAISKREDMDSVQRARAINGINKSGKFPQELA